MPDLTGPSHIDLTVTDVDRSVGWWEQVMGFSRISSTERPTFRTCSLVHGSGFTVTVVSHDATESGPFDETRVGLDHFGFAVADRPALDAWVAHFDALGVVHSGIIEAHYGDTVVFRDPDNIQLDLFVFNPGGEDLGQLLATDPHRPTSEDP
jgi:catechol 2,3-dioxygenase-like lactoylglutathione lyase family enzyme